LHNIGVLFVGFGFAYLGRVLDSVFNFSSFNSFVAEASGIVLMMIGFILRVWATFMFYENKMKVIKLEPQKNLMTSGPFRYSRNPLYLGGNVFIFLGASLFLGSPGAMALTALNIIAVDFMIRREEKQLEKNFRDEWLRYKAQVRRWI
jgi:protein-S-isoprenylcysteine O-methyltransferase Ste14